MLQVKLMEVRVCFFCITVCIEFNACSSLHKCVFMHGHWKTQNRYQTHMQGCIYSHMCEGTNWLLVLHCVCVCYVLLLLLSYQSDVNWRFNLQWIIYPCSSLAPSLAKGLKTYTPPKHTHTDLHVCMHTQSATSHCRAELYSRSSYKYLYLSRLIFISSSRAHIRGAAGWWGYPETERRERRGEEGRGGGEKWSDEGGRDRKLDRMLNSEIPLQIRSLVKRKGGDISSVWMNIWKKLEEWINEENNKKKQLHWLKLAKC